MGGRLDHGACLILDSTVTEPSPNVSSPSPSSSLLPECTTLVMEDAKGKKKEWQQRLADMELQNLLQLRDSLMASACIHLMGVDDCRANCDEASKQV